SRFEQVVLGGSGILQTIPSLALLALLVSVLAITGAVPTIVALFVYSLLPIVRTTHSGLTQIPESVRDSARSLGLPRGRMLLDVELPLALPSIFVGIKTAVVINVGTATLGAFIAAGGYGAPILAGIRRGDTMLILSGLIPAALMAIVLTLLLDLLERVITPSGARSNSS
ncbi:MAG: ABC transporter permease, partial [Planctomycetota bacterium]